MREMQDTDGTDFIIILNARYLKWAMQFFTSKEETTFFSDKWLKDYKSTFSRLQGPN